MTRRAATWTDATRGMVGEALKGHRDRVYVATKVKPGFEGGNDPEHRRKSFSLKVDYVDLLLHALSSAEQVMNTEYREVLAEAKKSGKTRFIGVTTHSKEPDVLNAVTDDPDKLYDTVLVTYNFQKPPEVKAAIAKAAAANIGIIAMKTCAADIRPGNCIIVSAEFNHKTATERDKATVEKSFARAELDSRQLVSRGSRFR